MLSIRLCCEPKTALKYKVYLKKKKHYKPSRTFSQWRICPPWSDVHGDLTVRQNWAPFLPQQLPAVTPFLSNHLSSKMQKLENRNITCLTQSFLRSYSAASERLWECQYTGLSEKREDRMERKQEIVILKAQLLLHW